MAAPHASLDVLARRCRALGLPLTIQRRAILEVLLSRDDHPTADAVATALAKRIEGISRATVYRTLETLVENGLIVRVSHHGAATRYDIRTDRHHHLVCDQCGAMTDFDEPGLDALRLPDFARAGFAVRDYSVQVRGRCRKCSRAASPKSTKQKE
jgi:Fur family peroxide stress response transcriptional regulator